MLSILQLRLD